MSRPDPGSRAAELRTALLRAGRARHEDFQVTLAHFAVERLLHRLSGTRHAESFVLKGAMLLGVWTTAPHRATRDVDLLGFGSPAPEALAEVFREIARADGEEDAVEFDPLSVRAEEIREDSRYDGVRVRLEARFGSARIPVQVDIGFGDAVTPSAEWIDYPSLIGLPTARIRAYTRESVISEKLEAMISLGLLNSRMKDFYDVWVLARDFEFDGVTLSRAIHATFERRGTPLPGEIPAALGESFHAAPDKLQLWARFLERAAASEPQLSLATAVSGVRDFAWPVLVALREGRPAPAYWPAGGPWIAVGREPRQEVLGE